MPKFRIIISKGEKNPFTGEYPKGYDEKDADIEEINESRARMEALKWIKGDKALRGYKIIKVEIINER